MPPPGATLLAVSDRRYPMTQAIYGRTMSRLRVAIRLLTVVLLALVARSVIDGFHVADVITGTAIALLLIASVGLWRQGRRLRPYADARQGGSDDDSARTRGMAGPPRTERIASWPTQARRSLCSGAPERPAPESPPN
jgi:hypothetical protein